MNVRPRIFRHSLTLCLLALWVGTGARAQSLPSDEAFARGVSLHAAGDYARAAEAFAVADSLDKVYLDPDDSRSAYASTWLASCYYRMGDEERARSIDPYCYYLEPVDRRVTTQSDALCDQANQCANDGDVESTIELYRRAGAIESAVLGPTHYFYGNTCYTIAQWLYYWTDDFDGAVAAAREAMGIFTASGYRAGTAFCHSLQGEMSYTEGDVYTAFEHYQAADSLFRCLQLDDERIQPLLGMSRCMVYAGDYEWAVDYMQQCYDLLEPLPESEDVDYVKACLLQMSAAIQHNEGNAYGTYVDACSARELFLATSDVKSDIYFLYSEFLRASSAHFMGVEGYDKIVKQVYEEFQGSVLEGGLDHMAVVRLYYLCNPDGIPFDERVTLMRQLADEVEELSGERGSKYLTIMADILQVYCYDEGYSKHIEEIRSACLQVEELLGDTTIGYGILPMAEVYRSIATFELALRGDTDKAAAMLKRSIQELQAAGLNKSGVYANQLHALGDVYWSAGDNYNAYVNYSLAIDIYDAIGMGRSNKKAEALMSLTNYYKNIGDYKRGKESYDQARSIMAANGYDGGSDLYLIYNPDIFNDLPTAADEIARVLEEMKGRVGNDNMYYRLFQLCYGMIQCLLGNYDEADKYITASENYLSRLIEHNDITYYIAVARSALQVSRGNTDKAIEILTDCARRTEEHVLNPTTKLTVYESLLNACTEAGLHDEAARYADRMLQISKDVLSHNFRTMTYGERTNFWALYSDWFTDDLPATAYRLHRADLDCTLYDATLMSKGLLLNSEIEVKRLIAESDSPQAMALYEKIQTLGAMRKKAYASPDDYKRIGDEIEELERQLVNLVKDYGDYTRNLTIGYEDVRSRLAANEAAVEFVAAPVGNNDFAYSALVLRPGRDPLRVELCTEQQLAAIPPAQLYTTTTLYDLLWAPMKKALDGVGRVYFSPQRLLYSMAIEYAPIGQGQTVDALYPELYRLSSTRELAIGHTRKSKASAVLYGGLTYGVSDVEVPDVTAARSTLDAATQATGHEGRLSQPRAVVENIRGATQGVSDLAYTLDEVNDIAAYHRQANDSCTVVTGSRGTEESVKRLSGTGISLLHLATHGFYFTDSGNTDGSASLSNDITRLLAVLDNSAVDAEDRALTRSGLYMSGVNATLEGRPMPAHRDDGILTAQEIAKLDLRGLDLVVLSACRSGLGELSGDGVFGLQRGFKKAGAHSLLMSLWKVDDLATRLLMAEFYRNYLGCSEAEAANSNGSALRPRMTKREALLKAQHALRTAQGGRFDKPELWAAFILLDATD